MADTTNDPNKYAPPKRGIRVERIESMWPVKLIDRAQIQCRTHISSLPRHKRHIRSEWDMPIQGECDRIAVRYKWANVDIGDRVIAIVVGLPCSHDIVV